MSWGSGVPAENDFVAHVLDLLAGWGGVSARRMFSGFGLFRSGVMFALIAHDTLYLKTDERNRGAFEAAGTRPFVYSRKSEQIALSYWEAPAELFDEPEDMIAWARRALDAAMANQKARKRPRRKPR
jgi:DNA transformation protein and related proteins